MSALTDVLNHNIRDGGIISYKMAAVKIYKGALVGMSAETTAGVPLTGYVTNLIVGNTNSYIFCGVADETVDNSSGSAGGKNIRVRKKGIYQFSKTTAAVTDLHQLFSVSDNQTVAALATKAAVVGVAVGVPDSSHLDIMIDAFTLFPCKSNPSTQGDAF